MRKICVVTGSRADYGLLRRVIRGVREAPELQLQLVVSGMHLSPEFGLTCEEIKQDGFRIDHKVEMLLSSDSAVGIAKSMGLGLIGYADALAQLKPDLMIVLGDRFEILAAVMAALVARIPVAHLHGGEVTEGAVDEAIRHSITKMSHLHFVAAEEYRRRVIQLGESPDRVFVVGGMGVDNIKHVELMDRSSLEASLGFRFGRRNLLVTFHPPTLASMSPARQMEELLAALEELGDTHIIFTFPNADAEGRSLMEMIERFVAKHENSRAYASLGQLRYLSCIAQVDGVVGNSSSGLLEVPSFRKGTINIGDRQYGRLQAKSVINCEPDRASIGAALGTLYSVDFQSCLGQATNPYGEGGGSEAVLSVVKSVELDGLTRKRFIDMPVL